VTGAGTTTAGQIIGPWATGGTAANAQTDYVVYNANNIALANIAASAENTWGTTYALGNNYTFTTNVGNTTATRNINSLRYTGAGGTIMTLNSFNLNTYGILQAGNTATATIAAAGSGALSTPTGGGNLFLTTGGGFGLTISAPINDNGGAVTPVISGSNIVALSSTASNYSGGTVINSGTLSIGANTNLGAVTGGLTFNNSGGLTFTAGTTVGTAATPGNRAIALNNGALATITTGAFNSSLIGNISGTGGIILAGTSGNTLTINGLLSTQKLLYTENLFRYNCWGRRPIFSTLILLFFFFFNDFLLLHLLLLVRSFFQQAAFLHLFVNCLVLLHLFVNCLVFHLRN
jgi:hypothetical protein